MIGSHIALFAGVGMTDIAVQGAGFKTIATAEIDPWCRNLLKQRYPRAFHYQDVRHIFATGQSSCARPLLISGGFPCQDVSAPGTGLGLSGERSGLWSEFKRVIAGYKPEYVLIENSALLKSRGLHIILADLHAEGYDARWDCFPAAAFGAPHLRDRMYIVAWKSDPHGPFYLGGDEEIARIVGGVATVRGSDPSIPLIASSLPRAGELCHGVILVAEPVAPIREARKACLAGGLQPQRLFPTPTKSDGSGGPGTTPKRTGGKNLRTVVAELEGNGRLNPNWVEWMMGLPINWTDMDCPNDNLLGIQPWTQEPPSAIIPRTVADRSVPDRTRRIQALGNGLVWPCAAAALDMIPNLKGK